jgi:trehalose 6-phosphate synthase/phosphatase
VRHFVASLLRILSVETRVDRIQHEGREIGVGSFPMGVDAAEWGALGDSPAVRGRAEEIRAGDGCRLFVGIDRLDYTKGIPRRLLAYEDLLARHPELHGRVRLVQVAVPSRGSVDAYREFRQQVDMLVGRIQGRFATPTWSPVRYMHRALEREEVAALYRVADVLLVTPIRDGMNLVAKEFAAARTDDDGVLVLSEFAGAAAEFAGALLVNPYDVEGSARVYHEALELSPDQRRARMRLLRERVSSADVHGWANSFLSALQACAPVAPAARYSSRAELSAELARAGAAPEVVVLLDYDGTLVPFATRPADAALDPDLLALLAGLAGAPGVHVHIVSGRPREELEAWFGDLDVGLHAEHGLWSRMRHGAQWRRLPASVLPNADQIAAILEDWAARTPGSFVERKSEVLAWHWRQADPVRGRRQEGELRLHLADLLSNVAVEVIVGDRVIEVRPQGVHKGTVLSLATAGLEPATLVVAIGDDRTDEDLFAVLEPGHLAVHVGERSSLAGLRLHDPTAVRRFLRSLIAVRHSASTNARRAR